MAESREGLPEADSVRATPWDRAAWSFTRWHAGDATAVDDLVREMTPILWQVVRAYRLDRVTAEDVVQETWMTFMRCHETIQHPQAVANWLIVTGRRAAARAATRARRSVATEADALGRSLPDAPSAEDGAVLDDEAARLWAAVRQLDERCQRLLRVVAFSDRPDYKSLTEDLGMPVGSIGPTRARCLGKVRRALQSGVSHG